MLNAAEVRCCMCSTGRCQLARWFAVFLGQPMYDSHLRMGTDAGCGAIPPTLSEKDRIFRCNFQSQCTPGWNCVVPAAESRRMSGRPLRNAEVFCEIGFPRSCKVVLKWPMHSSGVSRRHTF